MKTARRYLLLLLALTPAIALAQAVAVPELSTYAAKAGDYSLGMLAAIFGSANGIFGGAPNERFNAMLMAFNVSVLSVGAFWFGYNIVSSVVQGSWDGEAFGKRYSTVWMPIRTVTGAAGLVPVWSGWNGAQLLMAGCASLGIGIGNLVNSGMGIPEAMATSIPVPVANVQEIGAEMVRGHFCVQDQLMEISRLKKTNVYSDYPGTEEFKVPWSSAFSLANETDSEGKVHVFSQVNYGSQPAYFGHSVDECGSSRVELPSPRSDAYPSTIALAAKSRDVTVATMQGLNSDLQNLFTSTYQGIDPDDPDQTKGAYQKAQEESRKIIKKWTDNQARLQTVATAAVNDVAVQEMKVAADKYGWLGAGVHPAIAAIHNFEAASQAPRAGAGKKGKAGTETDSCQSFATALKNLSVIHDCIEIPLIKKVRGDGLASMLGSASNDPLQLGPAIGNKAVRIAFGLITFYLVLLGIIAAGAAIWGVSTIGLGAVALGPAATILSTGLQIFGTILTLICVPLLALGAQLSVYLPLIIPMAWIMAVFSWLLVVAESLIAAPLWALAHLDPEGEGMGQRTAHGYIFGLNLLFRPAVLVFAAWFAFRVCGVMGGFANGVLSPIIARMMEANEDSLFMVIFMLICGLWMLVSLNTRIVSVSASLLSLMPNQIFTWIGGHFGSDVGSGISSEVGADVKGGIEKGGSNAGQSIGSSAGQSSSGASSFLEKYDAVMGVKDKQKATGGMSKGKSSPAASDRGT